MTQTHMSWKVKTAIACFLLMALGYPSTESPAILAQGPAKKSTMHALLVGVTVYPNLNERFWLKGPANDVLLMQDLLIKQFKCPKENVTILSEAEGKKDEKNYPTRAAIKREWDRLAKVAQAGDQIVIMMGGHGSQQPEPEEPADPEPDGLDEIFLPRDVKEWEGDASKVPNAIIDDEIGAWLKAIQKKKAFIWLVFDSCHSGSMIRAVNETERQVKPTDDLKVPTKAIREAEARAAKRFPDKNRGGSAEPERSQLPKGGIVAIYACQSNEVTVERMLPGGGSPDAKPFGLLSYTIAQILVQAEQNGGTPPTYRELVQGINNRYGAMGRTAPTPQIEGNLEDRNREVLGTKSWPGRSAILLSQDADVMKINAGTLHGMSEGSILAVKPLADQKDADKVLGHVRVEEVSMTSAKVKPCAFEKTPLQAKLPEEARCEVAYLDFGVKRMRIAVDPKDDEGKPLPAAVAKQLALDLPKIVGKGDALLQIVDTPDKAEWLIRWHQGNVYLLPAAEWSQKLKDRKLATRFVPAPLNAQLADLLHDRLNRIVRAENFKKLIGSAASDVSRGKTVSSVQVEFSLVRYESVNDKKGTPFNLDEGKVQLHHKDRIGMAVKNPNRFSIDLTILYVDSGFGIESYFPDSSRGENNRIRPNETLIVPSFELDGDKTFGLENLVIIAIKASSKEPVDFSFMAQPTLELAKDKRDKKMGAQSPLELLFETSLYGAGTTRAIKRGAVEDFSLQTVPWHLSPEVRPKKKPGGAGVNEKIPGAAELILKNAETLELISLDPGQPKENAKDAFHGWKVLGKTSVKDANARKNLVEAFEDGVRESDGTVARCFSPRHGIRATHEDKTADFVIYFECLRVRVTVNGEDLKDFALTDSPAGAFNEVLKKAGVALPKPPALR